MTRFDAWAMLQVATARIIRLASAREPQIWAIGEEIVKIEDNRIAEVLGFGSDEEMWKRIAHPFTYGILRECAMVRRGRKAHNDEATRAKRVQKATTPGMTKDEAWDIINAATQRLYDLSQAKEPQVRAIGDEVVKLEDSRIAELLPFGSNDEMLKALAQPIPYPTLEECAAVRRRELAGETPREARSVGAQAS